MYSKKTFLFIIAILGLSFLTFRQAFFFDFWRDDWYVVWALLHHPMYLYQWGVVVLHPISALSFLFSGWMFGANIFLWEVQGFLLRIIDTFFVYQFAFKFSKSKIVGVYASLIFASSPIGIEAFDWPSAIASALLIPLFCVSFYFWLKKDLSLKYKLLAWGFIFLTIIGDPFRGIFLPILLLIYDLMQAIQRTKHIPKISIKKVMLVIGGSIFLITAYSVTNKGALTHYSVLFHQDYGLPIVIIFRKLLNVFVVPFNAIGNFFTGWILQFPDYGDVGKRNSLSIFIGIVIVTWLIKLSIAFIKEKTKKLSMLVFLLLWIVFLYVPNWLIDIKFIPAITHRYFALSLIGFVTLLAMMVKRINKKYRTIVFLLIIIVNIYSANSVLNQEYLYRSKISVEKIWSQVNSQIPQNEKNDLFIYQGNSIVMKNAMLTAYVMPFGMRRKYTNPNDFPIGTDYMPLVKNLLCDTNAPRSFVSMKIQSQKNTIPLAHVYAWYYDDTKQTLINTTQVTRNILRKTMKCIERVN